MLENQRISVIKSKTGCSFSFSLASNQTLSSKRCSDTVVVFGRVLKYFISKFHFVHPSFNQEQKNRLYDLKQLFIRSFLSNQLTFTILDVVQLYFC